MLNNAFVRPVISIGIVVWGWWWWGGGKASRPYGRWLALIKKTKKTGHLKTQNNSINRVNLKKVLPPLPL